MKVVPCLRINDDDADDDDDDDDDDRSNQEPLFNLAVE